MPPVIGSPSLKAHRNGLSQLRQHLPGGSVGRAAGSSGAVGTRPGMARGAAL